MQTIAERPTKEPTAEPTSLPELPPLGFRNYWYPVAEWRRVARRPRSVRVLGEDLVLFQANGKPAALVDRCAHRGARLSRGRILFPNTLSCPYHGWTYDSSGECRAAIVEGPDSKVPGTVRVKAYPSVERFGIVWVFMGEGEPPPLEEDLPQELFEPGISTHFAFTDWKCSWRFVADNYPDMCHATFVHRNSIELFFNRLPAFTRMVMSPLKDGKGLEVGAVIGGVEADYPGLGKFPARSWWRVLKRRTASSNADVRMPGYIVVRLREPFLGFRMSNLGWPVPVDENLTRHLNLVVTYPVNAAQRLAYKAWHRLYFREIHTRFVGQDRRILETQDPSAPEHLSATDVGLIQWRKLAPRIARQPAADGVRP